MDYTDLCSIELDLNSLKTLNISDEEYFSKQYCNYSSNSKLKLINPKEGGSPEKYFNGIFQGYSPSLEFGSAIHELILQPESFKLVDYFDKPSAKLGYFVEKMVYYRKQKLTIDQARQKASEDSGYYVNKLTDKIFKNAVKKGLKYYLDLYFEKLNSKDNRENIILSKSVLQSVKDCMNVYNRSSLNRFLHSQNITGTKQHFNELALFVDIKVTLSKGELVTIPFKLKIDNYSVDDDTETIILNDLKTTSNEIEYFMGGKTFNEESQTFEGFLGSFQKLHYYRQLAAYMYILQAKYKDSNYHYFTNILAIESKYPYNVDKLPIQNAYIQKGLKEFKELLCRVAYHTLYGIDKNYGD